MEKGADDPNAAMEHLRERLREHAARLREVAQLASAFAAVHKTLVAAADAIVAKLALFQRSPK
jgi:hypothetical protein